jgi:hypothetical protein
MDVPAALGVALTGISFSRFLAAPSRPSALMAGLALGTALLGKFSTVLLVPLWASLVCLWLVLEPQGRARYLAGLGMIGVSAALLVLLPYLWMTAHYPPEQQRRDAYFTFWGGEQAHADFAHLAQDRTRDLRAFVDTQEIDRIAVAYFGGSSPPYELARRYLPWHSALGPYKGWLAVSVTSWQIARALQASHPEDAYEWL